MTRQQGRIMKKTHLLLAFGIAAAAIVSCNKHEVIPPPIPMVDLEAHFIGKISGTDLELTENVNGFYGSSDADFELNANDIDRAVYYSRMSSNQTLKSVSVGHGSVLFDAATSPRPTLSLFNNFYGNPPNIEPPFSIDGYNGFVFRYTDASGRVWLSNENHSLATEDVLYSNIKQESDTTGDYHKFIVSFECYVYSWNDVDMDYDSMAVTDAIYEGWYKR